MENIRSVLAANLNLQNLVFLSIRIVFIAIAFEFLAWWLGRRVEKITSPLMTADSGREHAWRIRRRTILRQSPKIITRTLCYAVALVLILDAFGASGIQLLMVPVLPLAIAIGIVLLVVGLAMLPILRDLVQGYALLAEDAMAVGDVVQIDGQSGTPHNGTVERFTLRGLRLRDGQGRIHVLSNRDISHVVVHQRREEGEEARPAAAFDPLDEVPVARSSS